MSDPCLSRGVSEAPTRSVRLFSRLARHIRSRVTSYDTGPEKVKQPVRLHYPNLSPTRAPLTEADVALWPAWTRLSVEDINLDAFDDDGYHLYERGRRS
jgi:hypothetical protein